MIFPVQGDRFGDTDEAFKRMFSPEFRNRLDAKVDFAPLLAMAIVLGLAYLAQEGRNVPLTDLRIPSFADLYQKLPL